MAGRSLEGVPWPDAVGAAFNQEHLLLIGVNANTNLTASRRRLSLNPTRHVLRAGEELLVIAPDRASAKRLNNLHMPLMDSRWLHVLAVACGSGRLTVLGAQLHRMHTTYLPSLA